MPEYQDWIIRRLEGELDNARKETDALRSKLEAREERIRVLAEEAADALAKADVPGVLGKRWLSGAIAALTERTS